MSHHHHISTSSCNESLVLCLTVQATIAADDSFEAIFPSDDNVLELEISMSEHRLVFPKNVGQIPSINGRLCLFQSKIIILNVSICIGQRVVQHFLCFERGH